MKKIYYENNNGKKIDMYDFPIAIEDITVLYNKEWECETTENKKRNFSVPNCIYRTSLVKKMNLVIYADSESEFCEIANNLEEITEIDVLNETPGKLWVDDYYLKCMFTNITPSEYEELFCKMDVETNLISFSPFWCREKKCYFPESTQAIIDEGNREKVDSVLNNISTKPDYPFDYPKDFVSKYRPAKKRPLFDYKYDFYHNHGIRKLNNDHFSECNFKMIVYGPCTHPQIRIGETLYEVNTTLYDSEYMVIDSRERTVVKYARNGVQENLFNARSRDHEVFAKIQPGKLTVSWNAQYSFDVILYQERSVPPWTIS